MGTRNEIFATYHPRVLGFFKSRGFPEEDARDLTQETFLRVFQSMDKLRSEASLDSWVLRIAANLWKNDLRYHKAEKRDAVEVPLESGVGGDSAEPAVLAVEDGPSPLHRALVSERLGAVGKCLDLLPPGMKRCLVLHVHQDRKYQEIADLLKISIQSVKSHIHQARRRLEDCVDRRLAGEGGTA